MIFLSFAMRTLVTKWKFTKFITSCNTL